MKKIIYITLVSILFICCDKEVSQYNDWMIGQWSFNETEYIRFMNDDVFIMNDTIQGSYEVEDENDTELWYYYISTTGNTKGYGTMICEDIFNDHMQITNLPLHEGETIKIYKK